MQLWERLTADAADHVHGLIGQKVEPGLCQGQEVFCLMLRLPPNIKTIKSLTMILLHISDGDAASSPVG